MSRDPQRGASKLKTTISLLVLVALVYVGVKVVPAYVDNYQLEDAMKTEARFAAVNRKSPDQVRRDVYKKIQELGIPATPEDIRVVPTSGYGIRITVKYTVVVDLPGYTLRLNFEPTADNMSI